MCGPHREFSTLHSPGAPRPQTKHARVMTRVQAPTRHSSHQRNHPDVGDPSRTGRFTPAVVSPATSLPPVSTASQIVDSAPPRRYGGITPAFPPGCRRYLRRMCASAPPNPADTMRRRQMRTKGHPRDEDTQKTAGAQETQPMKNEKPKSTRAGGSPLGAFRECGRTRPHRHRCRRWRGPKGTRPAHEHRTASPRTDVSAHTGNRRSSHHTSNVRAGGDSSGA